jgi:protein-tyrosine sulfotransferase
MNETMRINEYLHSLRRATSVKRRSYPIHGSDRYQPFFIVGSGRSGSTLLRRMLMAHPSVHIPPETYVPPQAIQRYSSQANANWNTLADLVLATFEYHPEFDKFNISLRELSHRQKTIPDEKRNLAQLIDSIYRYHAEQQGKTITRWGDKTPLNTFYLPSIYAVFPDAKFVHILRDGRDCIASMITQLSGYNVETAADRWLNAVRAANKFSSSHPDACYRIRYEDLTLDPEKSLSQLCAFLGIEYSSDMINSERIAQTMGDVPALGHHDNVAKKIFRSSVGRASEVLSQSDMDFVTTRLDTELRKLGYL